MELLQSRTLIRPRDFRAAVDACISFGLRSVRCYGPLEDPVGVVFALGGGGTLELSRQPGTPPQGVTLWLQVPDIRVAASALSTGSFKGEVGAVVLQPWGLLECEVGLFDGVCVTLVEVPPAHPLHWRQ